MAAQLKTGATTGLEPKQARFVQEYLLDYNGTQAAIRAGYSRRSARQIGYELLKKPDVSKAVRAEAQRTEQRLQVTRDDVLRGLVTAFEQAKAEGHAMAMIAACREIGKLMGYYDRRSREVEAPVEDHPVLRRLEELSDEELMVLAAG